MGDHITASEIGLDPARLPSSEQEAQRRFERWRGKDPFPDIEPALLNTADLFDYIATTGMIHPFDLDEARIENWLKPASCGIPLGGRYIYWRYEGLGNEKKRKLEKIDRTLGRDGEVELPANSIVYATLAPTFRLPDYIAARFNLSINFVYRGLLVGTGPLVDPGFQGRLSIPLHNLTAYPCRISAQDAVLWMEFTKLSSNRRWQGARSQPRHGVYVPFPKRKLSRKDVNDYVMRARGDEPIVSSIPSLAEKAAEEARRSKKYSRNVSAAAIATLLVGLATLLAFVWDVDRGISGDADTALERTHQGAARIQGLEARIGRLEEDLRDELRDTRVPEITPR